MIGHLGARTSALLDGQLAPEEEERAWSHVHACHACRDLVEREGWVKTRLAELTWGLSPAPATLKGSLLGAPSLLPPGEAYLVAGARPRHRAGVAALGTGAVGVAVVGLLALGAAPASAPAWERRTPVTSLVGFSPGSSPLDGVGSNPRENPRPGARAHAVRPLG